MGILSRKGGDGGIGGAMGGIGGSMGAGDEAREAWEGLVFVVRRGLLFSSMYTVLAGVMPLLLCDGLTCGMILSVSEFFMSRGLLTDLFKPSESLRGWGAGGTGVAKGRGIKGWGITFIEDIE